jgi:tRNA-dihydrouridine synthase C
MLGRGLVARPDLARQIAAARAGQAVVEMDWAALQPLLADFWQQARRKMSPRYAPGRLKQWLAMLTRSYPEAFALFNLLRRENDCLRIDALLGVDVPLSKRQEQLAIA